MRAEEATKNAKTKNNQPTKHLSIKRSLSHKTRKQVATQNKRTGRWDSQQNLSKTPPVRPQNDRLTISCPFPSCRRNLPDRSHCCVRIQIFISPKNYSRRRNRPGAGGGGGAASSRALPAMELLHGAHSSPSFRSCFPALEPMEPVNQWYFHFRRMDFCMIATAKVQVAGCIFFHSQTIPRLQFGMGIALCFRFCLFHPLISRTFLHIQKKTHKHNSAEAMFLLLHLWDVFIFPSTTRKRPY